MRLGIQNRRLYSSLFTLAFTETAFGTSIRAQHKGNPKYVEAVSSFLEIFTLRFFSPWMANDWLFRFSELYPRYKKHLKILHDFTNNVIKDRRAARKERKDNPISEDGIKIKAALLDMLLDASENGYDLTDEDIRAEVDTFMFEVNGGQYSRVQS